MTKLTGAGTSSTEAFTCFDLTTVLEALYPPFTHIGVPLNLIAKAARIVSIARVERRVSILAGTNQHAADGAPAGVCIAIAMRSRSRFLLQLGIC